MSRVDLLFDQLSSSMDARVSQLRSELRQMQTEITMALNDLDARIRIDSHMIHNHGMLTEQIARYNMLLDILPVLEAEAKG